MQLVFRCVPCLHPCLYPWPHQASIVLSAESAMVSTRKRRRKRQADIAGDDVDDIAGMGAVLFGAFANATCAALVLVCGGVSSQGHSHLQHCAHQPSGQGVVVDVSSNASVVYLEAISYTCYFGYGMPGVHQECTRSAPGVHQECTRSAPGVHQECTRSAPGVHQECTRSAPGAHQERTRSAPGAHQERTRSAPGAHQERTRSAPGARQERARSAPGARQERARSAPGVRVVYTVLVAACLTLGCSEPDRRFGVVRVRSWLSIPPFVPCQPMAGLLASQRRHATVFLRVREGGRWNFLGNIFQHPTEFCRILRSILENM